MSLLVATAALSCKPRDPLTVYVSAASSTGAMMRDLAEEFENETGITVVVNEGASSTMARQMAAGAPCDIFLLADPHWLSYLSDEGMPPDRTVNLLSNKLVVVVPNKMGRKEEFSNLNTLFEKRSGQIAIGDPHHVPLGVYTKQSLVALHCYPAVVNRLVYGQNARSVLRLVECGEAGIGIVYFSDASASNKVDILFEIPRDSHNAITYPLGLKVGANKNALHFHTYLQDPQRLPVYHRNSFVPLTGDLQAVGISR